MLPNLLQSITDRILYRRGYFRMVDATSARSAPAMAKSIVDAFAPRRIVDYGCGTGSLLGCLRSLGVEARGTEFSAVARQSCRIRGLDVVGLDFRRAPSKPPFGEADVATSFEVAEHLPAFAGEVLVRLLASTAPMVVFSAATPGQGGQGHINEQPHSYWIEAFARHGMSWDARQSREFQVAWRESHVESWYCDNVMVFRLLESVGSRSR